VKLHKEKRGITESIAKLLSIFWIILADFSFFCGGQYTEHDAKVGLWG
jgi:hypothetical protein